MYENIPIEIDHLYFNISKHDVYEFSHFESFVKIVNCKDENECPQLKTDCSSIESDIKHIIIMPPSERQCLNLGLFHQMECLLPSLEVPLCILFNIMPYNFHFIIFRILFS